MGASRIGAVYRLVLPGPRNPLSPDPGSVRDVDLLVRPFWRPGESDVPARQPDPADLVGVVWYTGHPTNAAMPAIPDRQGGHCVVTAATAVNGILARCSRMGKGQCPKMSRISRTQFSGAAAAASTSNSQAIPWWTRPYCQRARPTSR
jgi:hypothetical protein